MPLPPARPMDPRPATSKTVLHTADVYVQPDGLVYLTDFNGGLTIVQWEDA